MIVSSLRPSVTERAQFLWSEHKAVPSEPGCYVIASYDLTVLYIGLATRSVRSRMGDHLDSAAKRKGAKGLLPYWLYFRLVAPTEVHALERGWLNQSILEDGALPPLNRAHSPIS